MAGTGAFDDIQPDRVPPSGQPTGAFDDIPASKQPGYVADVGKGAGAGFVRGVIGMASIPRLVEDVGRWTMNRIGNLAGIKGDAVPEGVRVPTAAALAGSMVTGKPPVMMPSYQDIKDKVEGVTGHKLYEPKTIPGQYASTIGEFVPSMVMPGGAGGGLATRFGVNVAAPAVAAETAGQMTKGTSLEPYARLAGGIAGPALPGLVGRAISPSRISPERAQQAATLAHEGIPLTAGQTSGSKPLRWAESVSADTPMAGGRAALVQENQAEQFTRAALRRAGIDAPRATPEVIDQAFQRIGATFDNAASSIQVRLARPNQAGPMSFDPIVRRVRDVAAAYERTTQPSLASQLPRSIADDLQAMATTSNSMDGRTYLRWRSELGTAARGAQDPTTRQALYDIQRALDTSAESFLRRSPDPAMAQRANQLRTARNEYRNMLVIERAATSAGENAALGLISPAALSNATKQQGRRAYARGQGDFGELARAGTAMMAPLPNSGTGPRIGVQMLGSAIGGGLGAMFGGPEGAMGGALLPHIGMALTGRTTMSPAMQAYLSNRLPGQAIGNALIDAPRAARYNALPGLIVQGNDQRTRR